MSNCKPDDCFSIPFPKKCAKYCIERVLRVAKPDEKRVILGMSNDLAQAIFSAYNSGKPINSFDDLRKKLTPNQVVLIKSIFDRLSQSQLDYFLPRLK